MKKVIIASFDMEVGGVERSLVSLLENIDFNSCKIDLMLYKHQGEFLSMVPKEVNLLPENKIYATFRQSMKKIFQDKFYMIWITRFFSRASAELLKVIKNIREPGTIQMQLMWKYSLPFLPEYQKEYDVAISYLWPHYFIAEKVRAKKKIAWIHTDYSTIDTQIEMDIKMWNKFDYIIAVSDACKHSFLEKYNQLEDKVIVMENLSSPMFVKRMANIKIENDMELDKRFKILTVARLSHAKGIDLAIQAMKLLQQKGYSDIVWYIVGYGGEEERLRDLIYKNDLGHCFILLGKQINPYPFIKAADLYVQPSRYEGKAITVGEAQILCKPVLITNYPTAQSQVKNGYDGTICEMSIQGIVDGIERLYKDIEFREKLTFNCKATNYDNSNELNKLYQLMQEGR
jgi:glycosyltransferase involved in cell wall biosynthesis